jgi:HAD superfamily hydrolase (TIGR01509 family)
VLFQMSRIVALVRCGKRPVVKQQPYLLFDVGGTLVFLNLPLLIRAVDGLAASVAEDDLLAAHFRWVHAWDADAREQGRLPFSEPRGYLDDMLDHLGFAHPVAERIIEAARDHHRQHNLWTFVPASVRQTLDTLTAQGYRMSVISNADGRVAQGLEDSGLAHYFEHVYDSTLVGVAKPDAGIFQLALHELALQPADALYIGDMYYNDVWGANRAGLGAVHLDPLGLYTGWPGVHLEGVHMLPHWLSAYVADPSAHDVRAARHLRLDTE